MRRDRKIIQPFTLGENLYLAMLDRGVSFKEISRLGGFHISTAYRVVERTPPNVTQHLIDFGKHLGFSEERIREKARYERHSRRPWSLQRGKFYRLLDEVFEFMQGDCKGRG